MGEAEVGRVLQLCAQMGRVLLANGAETYRVEDTIYHVASAYRLQNVHVFSVTNAIIFTTETEAHKEHTRIVRVLDRDIHLRKVEQVNQLSREIAAGETSLAEAEERMREIERAHKSYPLSVVLPGIALACGAFAVMFGGGWMEFLLATLVGGAGHLVYRELSKLTTVQFFSEVVTSLVIGLLAMICTSKQLTTGNGLDIVIVGALMPLVPGRAITLAIRDLMARDYISGVTVLAEGVMTAIAVGIGVAGILALM